jgi:hypothetical protein
MDAKTYTTWQLAHLAEVTDPDAHDGIGFENAEPCEGSPGARFLRSIAYSVEEAIEYGTSEDTPHEIADSAVPIYTHEKWATFTDLAAYTEDIEDFGPITDLDQAASIALYMIAERLARALIDAETPGDDTEEGDE